MSRPRTRDQHLPRCVHFRHGAYYFVKKGVWKRLGADLTEALVEYSRLIEQPSGGMDDLVDRVLKTISPRLAPATVAQYKITAREAKKILSEFAPQQVKPKHIAAIKVARAATPNMTNRLLSFLRIVFAHAVEWQEVESNPCIGIKRHAEAKRDRYIADAEYAAIRARASARLQLVMDMCYLTGQRITDVLRIRLNEVTDAGIAFRQQKSGAKLQVEMSADLRKLVDEAKALPRPKFAQPMTLFFNRKGLAPTYTTVRDEWAAACAKAGVADAHLHDLRAKALTDAKRQGHNPTALAGHASERMTDRYIRLRETPVVSGPSFGQSN